MRDRAGMCEGVLGFPVNSAAFAHLVWQNGASDHGKIFYKPLILFMYAARLN